MKNRVFAVFAGIAIVAVAVTVVLSGNRDNSVKNQKQESNLMAIGFSQVGAESDWRTANSISVKQTFTLERGYDLIFDDARQKQSNQIRAIRSFIQQDVDYIIFAPIVESGWDTVLEEAKRANIPVIVIDRMIDVEDESLYTAWVGSDFYLQGKKACEALRSYIEMNQIEEVNIVNIQGTLGATSQIERTQALADAVSEYGWNLLAQESGEYTEARAYEVMSDMLKQYEDINFVYCENDNEAFGAIDAIEAAGKTVGPDGDIQVLSFDATAGGLYYTLDGRIIIDLECNPLQGPEVEKIIKQLEAGEIPQKKVFVPEQIFVHGLEIKEIEAAGIHYEVQPVSEDLIKDRVY